MFHFIKKSESINGVLITLIILISANSALHIYNSQIILRNNELKKETEQVKQRTASIIGDVIHGADLSARGYALTKNDKLADPLKKVLKDKDSIFSNIESLLEKQHYSGLNEFNELRQEVDLYLKLTLDMIELARQDSMKQFVQLLNEDRGYGVWKKYEAFYIPLFNYEDELNAAANQQYINALARNQIIQWMLLLIGVPSLSFVIYRLRSDSKNRKSLLLQLEQNNRQFVFDPGTPLHVDNPTEVVESSMHLFRQATAFVSSISEGNYQVSWQGITAGNKELNRDNLAGKLLNMREQLMRLRQEEEKRAWKNEGAAAFSEIIRQHQTSIDDLTNHTLRFICKYCKAQQGSIFILIEENEDAYLKLSSCFAFDRKKYVEKRVEIGNGLLGQAYLEGSTTLLTEIPQKYLEITSGLGHASPSFLAIIPMKYNNQTEALLEIACFQKLQSHEIEFLEHCCQYIAYTLRTIKGITMTSNLLAESQSITRELSAREEEMRQSLSELSSAKEEVARAKEVAARLLQQDEQREKILKAKEDEVQQLHRQIEALLKSERDQAQMRIESQSV